MRILSIEPHGDDTFLSANSLLASDNEIDIITLSTRESTNLKKFYPSVKNVDFADIEDVWLESPILKTHQVHRDFLEGKPIVESFALSVMEQIPDKMSRGRKEVRDYLGEKDFSGYDIVLTCSGLVNPFHLIVRDAVRDIVEKPILYYGDKHYLNTRYAKEFYERIKDYLDCDAEVNPGYEQLPEENSYLKEVLGEVYPTEYKLLRFYSDIILNYPCKYIYNSRDKIIDQLVRENDL